MHTTHTIPRGGAIRIHLLFSVDFDVTFVGLPNVRPQTFLKKDSVFEASKSVLRTECWANVSGLTGTLTQSMRN